VSKNVAVITCAAGPGKRFSGKREADSRQGPVLSLTAPLPSRRPPCTRGTSVLSAGYGYCAPWRSTLATCTVVFAGSVLISRLTT
jgi:hypothetical protein